MITYEKVLKSSWPDLEPWNMHIILNTEVQPTGDDHGVIVIIMGNWHDDPNSISMSHSANTLKKGMHPTILYQDERQAGHFNLEAY